MSFNRTNSNGCPCKGCNERVPEPRCHMTCERYKEWVEKQQEMKEADRIRNPSSVMSEAKKRALWRSKRYSRQQQYKHRIDMK